MLSVSELLNYKDRKKNLLEEFELVACVHYYNNFAVALICIFLGEIPDDKGNIIELESLTSDLCPRGLGIMDSNAVLPLIYGNDEIFSDYFTGEAVKNTDTISVSMDKFNFMDKLNFPKDYIVSEDLTNENIEEVFLEAENLNNNLKKGDQIIFIKDYLEESIIQGLIAVVVGKDEDSGTLTVCPVLSSFKLKDISPKRITVPASICVPVYYADNRYLGPPVKLDFYSQKYLELHKINR